MQITVKGKQIEVGEALRGHMESALSAAVAKYFSNPLESQIVFTREAHLFRADVSVHVGRSILVQGQALAPDAYAAGDAAIDHVAKRLRRHKRRLRDHHKERERAETVTAQAYVLAADADEHADDGADDGQEHAGPRDQPVVIAEMTTEIQTLTVGEAVMRLDLGVQPALLFRHAGHGGLNLVYRRTDGNVGWIDPQGNSMATGGSNAGGRK
jgi:ribosomal subunit interface protein